MRIPENIYKDFINKLENITEGAAAEHRAVRSISLLQAILAPA